MTQHISLQVQTRFFENKNTPRSVLSVRPLQENLLVHHRQVASLADRSYLSWYLGGRYLPTCNLQRGLHSHLNCPAVNMHLTPYMLSWAYGVPDASLSPMVNSLRKNDHTKAQVIKKHTKGTYFW